MGWAARAHALTCSRHLGHKRTWSVAGGLRNHHALGRGNTGIRGRLSGHTSQNPDRRTASGEMVLVQVVQKFGTGKRKNRESKFSFLLHWFSKNHLRAIVILTTKKLGQLTEVIAFTAFQPLTLFVSPFDAQLKILPQKHPSWKKLVFAHPQ